MELLARVDGFEGRAPTPLCFITISSHFLLSHGSSIAAPMMIAFDACGQDNLFHANSCFWPLGEGGGGMPLPAGFVAGTISHHNLIR